MVHRPAYVNVSKVYMTMCAAMDTAPETLACLAHKAVGVRSSGMMMTESFEVMSAVTGHVYHQ